MPSKRRSKGKKTKKEGTGAEPMPSLIFNSVQLDEKDEKKEEKQIEKINAKPIFPGNHGAKKYMWAGVMGLSAIIFLLWGFAMVTKISHISIGGTPEGQLAASAKSDWNEVFEKTKAEETKKQVLNQLKNIIGQMMTTTTPSTTLEDFTTTTANAATASTTILTTTTTPTTTLTTTTKKIKK